MTSTAYYVVFWIILRFLGSLRAAKNRKNMCKRLGYLFVIVVAQGCASMLSDSHSVRAQMIEDAVLPMAQTALQSGQMETAKRLYERLLNIDPESMSARMGLGDVAFAKQDTRVARQWYLGVAVRAEDPSVRQGALLAHARAALHSGDIEEAREGFARLANEQKASPSYVAWGMNGLGLTSLFDGNGSDAVVWIERAAQMEPSESRFRENLDRAISLALRQAEKQRVPAERTRFAEKESEPLRTACQEAADEVDPADIDSDGASEHPGGGGSVVRQQAGKTAEIGRPCHAEAEVAGERNIVLENVEITGQVALDGMPTEESAFSNATGVQKETPAAPKNGEPNDLEVTSAQEDMASSSSGSPATRIAGAQERGGEADAQPEQERADGAFAEASAVPPVPADEERSVRQVAAMAVGGQGTVDEAPVTTVVAAAMLDDAVALAVQKESTLMAALDVGEQAQADASPADVAVAGGSPADAKAPLSSVPEGPIAVTVVKRGEQAKTKDVPVPVEGATPPGDVKEAKDGDDGNRSLATSHLEVAEASVKNPGDPPPLRDSDTEPAKRMPGDVSKMPSAHRLAAMDAHAEQNIAQEDDLLKTSADGGAGRAVVTVDEGASSMSGRNEDAAHLKDAPDGMPLEGIVVVEDRQRFLQFGAYVRPENAQAVAQRLTIEAGIAALIGTVTGRNGTTLHRVRLGPLGSRAELSGMVRRLEPLGYNVTNFVASKTPDLFRGGFVVREGDLQFLQAGAYVKRSRAETLADEIRMLTKYSVRVVEAIATGDRVFHRVRIGPLPKGDPLFEFFTAVDSHEVSLAGGSTGR